MPPITMGVSTPNISVKRVLITMRLVSCCVLPLARTLASSFANPNPNLEEGPHFGDEGVQAVVVHPMAGALERHRPGVLEEGQLTVLLGVGGPAFLAVHQQDGAGDIVPQLPQFFGCVVHRRERAGVVVELPAVGAVLVLAGAVDGEIPRLLGRQVLVPGLHPPERFLDGGVAAGEHPPPPPPPAPPRSAPPRRRGGAGGGPPYPP